MSRVGRGRCDSYQRLGREEGLRVEAIPGPLMDAVFKKASLRWIGFRARWDERCCGRGVKVVGAESPAIVDKDRFDSGFLAPTTSMPLPPCL